MNKLRDDMMEEEIFRFVMRCAEICQKDTHHFEITNYIVDHYSRLVSLYNLKHPNEKQKKRLISVIGG